MPPQAPAAETDLVGLFLTSIEYGIYLTTHGLSLRALHRRRSRAPRGSCCWPQLTISCVIFVLVTLKVMLIFQANLLAFALYNGPGGPMASFAATMSKPSLRIIQTVVSATLPIIGDAVLVHRCFAVFAFQRSVMIIPAILLFASSGFYVALIVLAIVDDSFLTIRANDNMMFTTLTNCGLGLTLATNLLTTCLMSFKLWRVNKETSRLTKPCDGTKRPARLSGVLRIMVDSGLLYTLFIIASFISTIGGVVVSDNVQNMLLIVIGISWNLIAIRVDAARTHRVSARFSGTGGTLPFFVAEHVHSSDAMESTETIIIHGVAVGGNKNSSKHRRLTVS